MSSTEYWLWEFLRKQSKHHCENLHTPYRLEGETVGAGPEALYLDRD